MIKHVKVMKNSENAINKNFFKKYRKNLLIAAYTSICSSVPHVCPWTWKLSRCPLLCSVPLVFRVRCSDCRGQLCLNGFNPSSRHLNIITYDVIDKVRHHVPIDRKSSLWHVWVPTVRVSHQPRIKSPSELCSWRWLIQFSVRIYIIIYLATSRKVLSVRSALSHWWGVWNKPDLSRFNSFADRWRYALVLDVIRCLPSGATELNRKGVMFLSGTHTRLKWTLFNQD